MNSFYLTTFLFLSIIFPNRSQHRIPSNQANYQNERISDYFPTRPVGIYTFPGSHSSIAGNQICLIQMRLDNPDQFHPSQVVATTLWGSDGVPITLSLWHDGGANSKEYTGSFNLLGHNYLIDYLVYSSSSPGFNTVINITEP